MKWEVKETGGPAFPQNDCHENHSGMTLRDYFAGQALIGFFSQFPREHVVRLTDAPKLAADCYAMADEMLKERAK